MPIGIYIHVPFCAKKCPYCDFYSCSYSRQISEAYSKSVIRDIENFPDQETADTIYFGGGTPSLIQPEFIHEILQSIYRKFNIAAPETTLEINPCTVNKDKLKLYKEIGINRLSVGAQSSDDNELRLLGRKHNFEKVKEVIFIAESIGFENISCDLMIGIPNQTIESLKNSIIKLSELPIRHISSYILKIEKGTPFDNKEFIKQMPDDEFVSDMYLFAVNALKNFGFNQYEISNFAQKGYESKHNLKYWQCHEYIGFGPSAHSFYKGQRYYYSPDLNSFIKASPEKNITDDKPADEDEKIMLGLRLSEGIDLDDFPDKKNKILSKAAVLEKAGLITQTDNRFKLTPKGFLVSNSIITEILY